MFVICDIDLYTNVSIVIYTDKEITLNIKIDDIILLSS